jgi:hypothetical protein
MLDMHASVESMRDEAILDRYDARCAGYEQVIGAQPAPSA